MDSQVIQLVLDLAEPDSSMNTIGMITFKEMYSLQEVMADFILNLFFLPKFPVHLSFPVLFGAGGISYITKETNDYQNMIEDSEVFLIAEPAAELEFNFTRNFRFALGASYRFTTPFDVGTSATIPVSSNAIESWSYMMTFKFGRF